MTATARPSPHDAPAALRRWPTGAIVGKFRPPHKGHSHLIEAALARVDRLTVFVCADASDTVPADLRAAWLRELHPEADVWVVETTEYDANDSALWAALTARWLGYTPGAVFTSEPYGEHWARALGCDHVLVDPERRAFPVSGSAVLRAPAQHLDFLAPPVRAYFVPRVVLVGADSTGKTTLARDLAEHYGTTWVPEYGRTFWDGLLTLPTIVPDTADFFHIARVQQELEDRLARHARGLLVCDTDVLATYLWHTRYVGREEPGLLAMAKTRRPALYLLPDVDLPWEDDGTRPDPADRATFQERFRQLLVALDAPFAVVRGSPAERVAAAAGAIENVLGVTRVLHM